MNLDQAHTNEWEVYEDKAIRDDGSLFFPERLTSKFLVYQRRRMGAYMFANQYQNEIIPTDQQVFKKEWLRYYATLPIKKATFCFIDPALSEKDDADFTALTVVDVDPDDIWYLRNAQRFKINPTKIVNLIFQIYQTYDPICIGIEDVAFQKALLYMVREEMKRRNQYFSVKGIKPSTEQTKEMRILGLVPRFEFGRILIAQGLRDFESEYSQFPRGSHDDLLDSLQYMEQIVFTPDKENRSHEQRPEPNDPNYETWYRKNIHRIRAQEED